MLSFVVAFVKQPTIATPALKLFSGRRFLPFLASSVSFAHPAAFSEPAVCWQSDARCVSWMVVWQCCAQPKK